jgi:Aerotolerance regulator N-terminal
MGLLNPGALAYFAVVPALVLAYLARERPSRATVSSVLAFRALSASRGQRFGGRPRFDWPFFVELLILSLAVLAIARPYVIRRANPIAVVLDNSAAMQARTPEGPTRFEKAQRELAAMLANEDSGTRVAVYLAAPKPHQAGDALMSLARARSEIAKASAVDVPADWTAVAGLLTGLASGAHYRKVIFAGSRALAPPTPARIDAITVGDPIANFAIGSFTLRREAFGAQALHARLVVGNFSPGIHTLGVVVTGDGRRLGTAEAKLGPDETGAIEFPSLPPADVYRAELSPADGFSLDNTAWATSGSVKSVSVLFVSPQPADAAGLNTIPGVSVSTRRPDAYTPGDLDKVDLAIFEYAVPKQMPTTNALFVMPPPGDPLLRFEVKPATRVGITDWSPTDPLTDSVNFRLLNIRVGEFFGVHPWMAPVVWGAGGGLLMRGEREGHRFVAAGFNPFPYLGKRNLPMSVLTLNILSYLAGVGANFAGYHTGQPWLVPAGVTSVVLPSGSKFDARPGTLFADVSQQGVYQLLGTGGTKTLRAVNLADFAVADFENVLPLAIETTKTAAAPGMISENVPLSPYIFALILALLMLEALLLYRGHRATPVEA